MKKRVLLIVVGGLLMLGVLNPRGETLDMTLADSFGGQPSNGCVSTHILAQDVSLVGLAQLRIDYHVKTGGDAKTVVAGRWESSKGGLGPTYFMESPFDNFVPAGTGRSGLTIGTTINIARGSTGSASYSLREPTSYPGCFYVDNIVITRIPYNDLPPAATPPPTPPPGEFTTPDPTATPTPTPTGHPTPTPVPTSPACSADPDFDEDDCPPPDGFCYGFGPPQPGQGWPIYECDTDPTPSPSPSPTPPGCATTSTVVLHYDHATNPLLDQDLTYRLIELCPQTASKPSGCSGGTAGCYVAFPSSTFTWLTGETHAYRFVDDNTITFTSPGDNFREGFVDPAAIPGGQHSAMNIINVAHEDHFAGRSKTSLGNPASTGVYAYMPDSGSSSYSHQGMKIWIGPEWPSGGTPSVMDADDVTPTPSPTASASASASTSPTPYQPPSPPVGYPSPDTSGPPGQFPSMVPAVPDPGAFDGVMLKLQSKAPFNYVIQVTTALEDAAGEAAGGAGPAGGTYGCFTLPRWTPEGTVDTEACVPLQEFADDAAPMRGALLAMLMIGIGVGILKWTMRATGGGS